MIPGARGIGREEVDQRLVALEIREIENRRDEGDAVELDAGVEQRVRQACCAGRSVAFADDELGTVPALILGQVALDCPGEGVEVLVDSEEILRLRLADLAR